MDWRHDSDYAFCELLDQTAWAWQFLRREPAYRADYAEFIAVWQQLEACYGAPPHRDFFKWKQDPRAWRSESDLFDCSTETCPGENNKILLECWMGAKWGLRKFPPDPAVNAIDDIAWREVSIEVESIENSQPFPLPPDQVALIFDLSLSLPAQLEAAKRKLISARQSAENASRLPFRNVRSGAPVWRRWLRVLDALEAGETLDSIAATVGLAEPEQEVASAIRMRAGGYRRILLLEH